MLLTDEEIDSVRDADVWGSRNELMSAAAKAQLRKVVDELSKYRVPSATPLGDIIEIFTEGNVWQSLLEDIGNV